MKHISRVVVLLLVVACVLGSVTAFADSYRVATLKKDTWYKLSVRDKAFTVYKLNLTADSIVTVQWKNNTAGEGSVYLCTDKSCDDSIYSFVESSEVKGSGTIALSRGSYYFRMFEWDDKPHTQVKITAQKATNQDNYCRARAIALQPNKVVKIAQTPDYNYSRWYRIQLPQKKTVTITTNDEKAEYISLYNSKMQYVSCASGSKTVISEDPLPKGTYFIRVTSFGRYDSINEYVGSYITMKWN